MYNLLILFCSVVNFPALPEFYKKSGSAGPAKIFQAKKDPGFFFSREKILPENHTSLMRGDHGRIALARERLPQVKNGFPAEQKPG